MNIIDIEGAWRFDHEDLNQNQGGVIGGQESSDPGWRNHGTAVIGEFSGDQNPFGIVGICSDANVRAISIFGNSSSSGAIVQAANSLQPGDIILIELHRPGPRYQYQNRPDQGGFIPIEWWPDDFDAIQYATGRGVIVVEAGGNGSENLDDPLYDQRPTNFPAQWTNPFNRSNRDSGAIVVGAGAPPPGTHGQDHGPARSRLSFSNYGTIMDAQGWGREVTTTGYGDIQGGTDENKWYTDSFSGTSSASPIVVGSLGCVQGVLRAHNLNILTPIIARNWLRETGSLQQDAPDRPVSQRIGNLPDLRQLIAKALNQ
ncbi:S8 family serine peptidase [Paenibacillus sp. JCM 10914]|uniref:S8 family serine peptidase n=1 Tax=Paenibacillus sp. JCM 10914 TaxID=1236974 RepID=UPI0003CCA6A2|nr:S8 family serine peptidase [Paenibacillus sp. JCM 10914]GAE06525.1 serine protease [Paenibacillus sp. JCM 10914]